jgi:hypothetical protein
MAWRTPSSVYSGRPDRKTSGKADAEFADDEVKRDPLSCVGSRELVPRDEGLGYGLFGREEESLRRAIPREVMTSVLSSRVV